METKENAELILVLASGKGGFMTLMQQAKIEGGMMCLVLEVMAKVVDSSTDGQTRQLMNHFYMNLLPKEKEKNNSMKDHLLKFVGDILPQLYSNRSRDYERYLESVFNFLKFLRSLQETLRAASLDTVAAVVLPLKINIEHLNRKGCIFTTETMELLKEVDEAVGNFDDNENETPRQNDEEKGAYVPPNDFREIPICPHVEDIQFDHEQFLPRNIVDGRYVGGVDHYLDVQFRLLREDFVRPLRVGISEYIRMANLNKNAKKKKTMKKAQDLHVYEDVRVVSSMMRNGELIYSAKFDTESLGNVRWQVRKLL